HEFGSSDGSPATHTAMTRTTRPMWAVMAASALVVACEGFARDVPGPPDASAACAGESCSPDAGSDATVDATVPETGPDIGRGSDVDAAPDVVPDALPDVVPDSNDGGG